MVGIIRLHVHVAAKHVIVSLADTMIPPFQMFEYREVHSTYFWFLNTPNDLLDPSLNARMHSASRRS